MNIWHEYCNGSVQRRMVTLPKQLPVVPSAKAGSMAETPSGIVWREQHPVIGPKCNQCLVCTLFCPEGALALHGEKVAVVQAICNGCGTCAVECPQHAVEMKPEYSGPAGVFPLREVRE